ncbi:MAG: YggT family protein [Desulfovibrionaceae bacterium]|nr:YggT family protein [Desulfovibrionaceae bacterium]
MFVIANIVDAVGAIAHMLISAYILVVLAACVISWFRVSPYHPAVRVLRQLTDPVFDWAHRRLPFTRSVSGLDLAPLAIIVGLELFDLIVIRSLRQLAVTL